MSSIILSDTSDNKEFRLPAAETQAATCIRIIELGTQLMPDFNDKTKTKEVDQLMLVWELPDEEPITDKDGNIYPMTISKTYTRSIHEKSGLFKDLCAWRGRTFTDEERAGFDIEKVLGAACTISIGHLTKGDKTYANITSISKLMKGVPKPAIKSECFLYEISMGVEGYFPKLSKWQQEKVLKSVQMLRSHPAGQAATASQPAEPDPGADVPDEDLPF